MSFAEDKILIVEIGKGRINYKKGISFFEDKSFETIVPTVKIKNSLLEEKELSNLKNNEWLQTESIIDSGIKEETMIFGLDTESNINEVFEDSILVNIFKDSHNLDWLGLRAILQYILTVKLGISIDDNDYAILYVLPVDWPRLHHEELVKITFDDLNFTATYFLEQPLASCYGYGLPSACVLHLGAKTMSVTPVIDNSIIDYAGQSIPVGYKDIDRIILNELKKDDEFIQTIQPLELNIKIIEYLREEGYFIFDKIKVDRKDDKSDKDNNSSTKVEYNNIKFELKDKYQLLINNVLFDNESALYNKDGVTYHSIVNLMRKSIEACDTERRFLLWENIILNGGLSKNKTLIKGLEREIINFFNNSENVGYTQPNNFKIIETPEYFRDFKETPHLLSFLGACICSKYVFSDPKLNISQTEFNQAGPSVLYNKSS